MPNIAVWDAFEYVDNNGSVMQDGSLDVPVLVAAAATPGKYEYGPVAIAQNAKVVLWDATNGPSTFTYLRIKSDVGDATNGLVMLELQTDETNAIGRQVFTVALQANVPFILGSPVSYANYTLNFGGGTLSTIQKITAKNLNSSAANIGIWIVD